MLTNVYNAVVNRSRYHTHPEAVVIACFYNPQHSPYRLMAFQQWYHRIKHLHHRILECTIGEDTRRQLPESPWITQVHTQSLLWHKETLLNKLIADLPAQYRYVFWVDTDVLLTNQRWLTEGVERLQEAMILQPFAYGVHLERNETTPSFALGPYRRATVADPSRRHPSVWRSFCANYVNERTLAEDPRYDVHGHVGFAWGASRELLEEVPLYDKALIGGADHIIAHAAAGQIPHPCLETAFPDTLEEVYEWAGRFARAARGLLQYVPGDLYHLWHGDLAKRQYLQRIRNFQPQTRRLTQDDDGFWIDLDGYEYMLDYYGIREVWWYDDYADYARGFTRDMGYSLEEFRETCPVPAAFQPLPAEASSVEAPLLVETETFTPLAGEEAVEQGILDAGAFS